MDLGAQSVGQIIDGCARRRSRKTQTPQALSSLRRIYLAVSRPIVPRAPSLELYVLPSGGGQLINFQKKQWS
jgi:hypothetical protein